MRGKSLVRLAVQCRDRKAARYLGKGHRSGQAEGDRRRTATPAVRGSALREFRAMVFPNGVPQVAQGCDCITCPLLLEYYEGRIGGRGAMAAYLLRRLL